MKNVFFLVLFFWVSAYSCRPGEADMIRTKPGYFCQLEAVAVLGDTIIIAGSFIPKEDPNLTVQPVYSYLAAFDKSGKMLWEQRPDEPDYIKWKFLENNGAGALYAIGLQESPLTGQSTMILGVDAPTGETTVYFDYPEQSGIGIEAAVALSYGNVGIRLARTRRIGEDNCLMMQSIAKGKRISDVTEHCMPFPTQAVWAYPYPMDYIAAYGKNATTDSLFLKIQYRSPTPRLALPKEFSGALVNDVWLDTMGAFKGISPNDDDFFDTVPLKLPPLYLASTTKNAQGPCLWRSGTDSSWEHTCLDYWPFHGAAQLKPYGKYILMAFNAADTAKHSAAHVVLFDESLKQIWQQEVSPERNFVIQDIAVYNRKAYVAGTIETPGDGSSIAVVIIPLPAKE